MRGSGDGFVTLADGSRRWGLYGAAGVLVRCGDLLFLARRSEWTHRGGTWAIPGGAIDIGESPLDAALREFEEETGIALAGSAQVIEVHEDDHGGWSYWTVVVDVDEPFEVSLTWESSDARWVPVHELETLPLFDAFEGFLRSRLGLLS